MTVHTLPFRARRADTRALALVRESIKADLMASKAEGESLALRILFGAVRIYIATAWLVMALVLCVLPLGLMAGLVWVAVRFAHLK